MFVSRKRPATSATSTRNSRESNQPSPLCMGNSPRRTKWSSTDSLGYVSILSPALNSPAEYCLLRLRLGPMFKRVPLETSTIVASSEILCHDLFVDILMFCSHLLQLVPRHMKRSLVAYSDSENSDKGEIPERKRKKRKQVHSSFTPAKPSDSTCRLLPTPSVSVVSPIPMDDPLKHQGRIRTTPHIDGQFAAYVYAPVYPDKRLRRLIRGILETMERRVQNVHRLVHFKSDELVNEGSPAISTAPLPTMNSIPHLSLTRPIYLRAHQRDILNQAVKNVAKEIPKCVYHSIQCLCVWVTTLILIVLRFGASFASFIVLDNDSKTRSFLALEIGAGHNLVSPMDSDFSTSDGASARRCAHYLIQLLEIFNSSTITRIQGFMFHLHGL